MASHLKIKTEENHDIHFRHYVRDDYTLCGLDTVGDETIGIMPPISTDKKVNCIDCISITVYCKNIDTKEFINRKQ